MLRNGQTHFKILQCHPSIVGHFSKPCMEEFNHHDKWSQQYSVLFPAALLWLFSVGWPKETSKNPVQLRMGQGIQEWTK